MAKTPEEVAAKLMREFKTGCDFDVCVPPPCACAESIATAIREAVNEEQRNYECAIADLDSALTVLIKRINGERDLASAAEWIRLNYPKRASELKPLQPSSLPW